MILEIALGIVLAVLILAFLPAIIGLGLVVAGIVVIALLAYFGYQALAAGWAADRLMEFGTIVLAVSMIGAWCWSALIVERHTKILAAEFIGLSLLTPATIYLAVLLSSDLIGGDVGHLPAHLAGFIPALLLSAHLVWRIWRRYKRQ